MDEDLEAIAPSETTDADVGAPTLGKLFQVEASELASPEPAPPARLRRVLLEEPRTTRPGAYRRWGKDLCDLALFTLTLPVALPLACAIFLLNALSFRSVRRAFFLQERVGRNGRTFRMVKFRTMKPAKGAMASWSSGQDVLRVTRFGRLLRNTHLDELPQIVNILRREMSFVGPRPEMTEVDDWAREHVPGFADWSHPLRPGVTGLAQITQGYVGRDIPGYARKHSINQRYARDISLLLDVGIVLRTFVWMARGRGWQWNAASGEKADQRGHVHEALGALLGGLDQAGVPYAVLRGGAALGGAGHAADVDLMIREPNLRRFEELLRTSTRDHGVTIHEEHRAGFLTQYYLHARTPAGEHEFLGLDLHTAECCYGVPFLRAGELLAERDPTTVDEPAHLAAHVSALIDFLGPYLSGGVVREDYARRLFQTARAAPRRTQKLLERVLGRRGAARFGSLLEREYVEALHADAARVRRTVLRRALVRHPLRGLLGLARTLYAARIRPLWRPRGRCIAFLGTDGTGKSTLAAAVDERLREVYRSDRSGIVHLRPMLLPQLNTLLHLGRTTYSLEDMARPHRAKPSGVLLSNLRVAYYWLDYVVGYAVRILPRRRRHSLVIFDRYFHDYLVDPLRSRIRRDTLAARALSRWVPQPDQVFVCTADEEVVCARKQELPPAESALQLRLYTELARERGFELISTNSSVEDCVDQVLSRMFPPT